MAQVERGNARKLNRSTASSGWPARLIGATDGVLGVFDDLAMSAVRRRASYDD